MIRIVAIVGARPQFIRATAGSHYALLMQSILPGIPLAGKVLFGLWQILPGPYAAGGAHPLAGIVS